MPNGTPVISLPKYGMGSSGLHSDNSTVDIFILNNEDGINKIVSPVRCIFVVDRGFMRYVYMYTHICLLISTFHVYI